MRVLIATDQWSPDVIGGAARVASETAHALARRGHTVTVVAPQGEGLPAVERHGSLELRRSIGRGLLPQTFSDVREGRRLAGLVGDEFDVVLAHQNTLTTGLGALGRLDLPLALVFHSSIPLEQRFRRRRLPPARRLAMLALAPALVAVERAAVRSAATILVLSRFSREILLAAHPAAEGRAVTVSGGIDAVWFEPLGDRPTLRTSLGLDGPGPLLASVRRLEPRMGHEELLRAAAILRADGVRFTLALAGDGTLAARLRALAGDLGLRDEVVFLGRISDERLRMLYAAADLTVVPTVAYEGFGIATVESLASGTPVVGTRVGATPEVLEPLDPGLVASSAAPEELAAVVRRTLDRLDEEYRRACADYARSRFAWDRAIVAWEDALEALASSGRR
jgi:glycosyltransferase involved in cell wall biosynthesis